MPPRLTAAEATAIGIQPIVARAIHIITDALGTPGKTFPSKEAADYLRVQLEHWCYMTGSRDLLDPETGGLAASADMLRIHTTSTDDPNEEIALAVLAKLAGKSEILAVLGEIIRESAPYPSAGARA